MILKQLKKYNEAIECFDKAIILNPNDAELFHNKGIVLNDLNKYNAAIECFNKAFELNQNYFESFNNEKINSKLPWFCL